MAPQPVHRRRFDLRDRTAAAHGALDARVGPLDSVSAYARYLRGIAAFRCAVEPIVAFEGWKAAAIAPLLVADMDDLNLRPAAPLAMDAPDCPSGRLGLAYVLEGSALGAQLLWRQAQALGFDASRGARHLAAQTAAPARWRGFCTHLEAAGAFDPAAAAAAATAGFAAALRAFEAVDAV